MNIICLKKFFFLQLVRSGTCQSTLVYSNDSEFHHSEHCFCYCYLRIWWTVRTPLPLVFTMSWISKYIFPIHTAFSACLPSFYLIYTFILGNIFRVCFHRHCSNLDSASNVKYCLKKYKKYKMHAEINHFVINNISVEFSCIKFNSF